MQISIIKGHPQSKAGAKLNLMALGYMAYAIAGSEEESILEDTFLQLWQLENNRFSYQYAFEAQVNGETLGMIICYPVPVMKRLAWPTFQQAFSYRKLGLVGYNLLNIRLFHAMAIMKEGEDDEFHIGTIATLPESRGMGIGTQLLNVAEEQAALQNLVKCSLTVKKENQLGVKLYERIGYRIIGEMNRPALYKMVKLL
ncbi:acetyltransferase (GNAT) family protein [Baia soyae]|uniref:Acetyltransferase (GNAT) family protein n=2 Tax=Baia soyae TaxID=1544746 RepID=A0A4R2RNM8_9BACL|nr:acetyltransferase (GNAT) family protein [Baia soyae]